MSAATTPVILTNPRLRDNPIIVANQAFCDLSGYPVDELVGRNCRFMQCPETDRDTVSRLHAAIDAAEPVEVVILNRKRDGARFWNRLLVAPILDPEGQVLLFFASQRDVTAEVQRLAQLEGHAQALEAALAGREPAGVAQDSTRLHESHVAAGAASWEWNPMSGEVRWSEGAETVMGGDRDTLPGEFRAWLARVHPDDRDRAMAGALEIGSSAGRFEYRLLRDGEARWIEAIGRVLARDDEGRAVKATGMVIDVTDRKHAESRARRSEARFQAMAEASPIIIFITDESGGNIYVSPQYAAFTGLSEAELLGHGWLNTLSSQDRERFGGVAAISPDTPEYAAEFRMRRHDGAWRWCLVRAVVLREGDDRQVAGWCGTLTDIQDQVEAREALARSQAELERLVDQRTMALTEALEALRFEAAERARAEEALRQAQKMEAIGQLTGGIAHDFNNLLTTVSSSLELLELRIGQGRVADASRYLGPARRAVQRGSALTQRLLAFARRQALEARPVEVDRLMSEMLELIRRSVGPQIEVRVELTSGATALCDANQLEAVVLNLAINARDAMPGGGTLRLATLTRRIAEDEPVMRQELRPGSYIEITVTDNGTGMAPGVLERAFDPFFTTKPVGQGTGLGLSQTYGFVRQSEGIVLLESVEGEGTTVRLLLPRHDAPEAVKEVAAKEASAAAPSGTRVLVVEDEAPLRELLRELLEDLGCVVLTAADGPGGLAIVTSDAALDILVTDVGLPGLDGRRLAEAARAVRPNLPVLFITGYPDEGAADGSGGALPAGMYVIGKPFTLAALAGRLAEILGGARHN